MVEIVTKPRIRVKAGRSGGNGIVQRIDGEPVDGPWYLPISGGWLSAEAGSSWNWWQNGYDIGPLSRGAMVEACIQAYAQTVAMCPGDHWLTMENGGRVRQTNSALYRWLRKPNAYQTASDFLLNTTTSLYSEGNAYALALRNSRFEIAEMHLMNPTESFPVVHPETGDIFYSLSGNWVIDRFFDYPPLVPARDVLHVKLRSSPYNPLKGISPIHAAAYDLAANSAMLRQQIAFYTNQARPSAVLSTDLQLDKTQVEDLRARWNEQVKGLASGGTPILTAGLKPVTLGTNPVDAQLAEMMKMTEQHVALAFRIPLQILGLAGGAPLGSTEALMQNWLAGSMGFCLNHVESAIDRIFQLKGQPDEYCELSTDVLLRSNFKDRMEGLVRGVQGGVLAPNEARAKEGYKKADFGDEPRVQQQLVPLSAASMIQPAPAPGSAPPSGAVKEDANDSGKPVVNGSLVRARVGYIRTRAG